MQEIETKRVEMEAVVAALTQQVNVYNPSPPLLPLSLYTRPRPLPLSNKHSQLETTGHIKPSRSAAARRAGACDDAGTRNAARTDRIAGKATFRWRNHLARGYYGVTSRLPQGDREHARPTRRCMLHYTILLIFISVLLLFISLSHFLIFCRFCNWSQRIMRSE